MKAKFNLSNPIIGFTITIAGLCGIVSPSEAIGFNRVADNATGFENIIGEFQQFANLESDALNLGDIGARTLDATQLTLSFAQNINIYFISLSIASFFTGFIFFIVCIFIISFIEIITYSDIFFNSFLSYIFCFFIIH